MLGNIKHFVDCVEVHGDIGTRRISMMKMRRNVLVYRERRSCVIECGIFDELRSFSRLDNGVEVPPILLGWGPSTPTWPFMGLKVVTHKVDLLDRILRISVSTNLVSCSSRSWG